MASPEEYRQLLSDLGLDCIEIKANTLAEGIRALSTVHNIQTQLGQIKSEINSDMKTVRAEYRLRISSAASTSPGLMKDSGKTKPTGRMRANEKERLRRRRDGILQPYENMKTSIDDLITQLDSAKLQTQEFIDKSKRLRDKLTKKR